ncbi:glycosyltransferase [Pseudoalteromonas sp. SMS1]|uniref:glycosyltransferase n=1 Tax=Pseudoalteromonas sp. SMS1 TaxID=2908894 RepID=UPI001F2257A6|nr:glycosyltransferase [Pseudoalteromonas sp. SMS1]MCF2859907.1 glycosyltransferase [Pseudoalteromonas sp. SMS1]
MNKNHNEPSECGAGVSVIIPTYNRRELLKRTLDSLCEQTLGPQSYEIIIVDDGSNDGTAKMVSHYQGTATIQYIFQPDEGFQVAKARNKGLSKARFDTILFLDCGMIAHPTLLSIHLQCHGETANLVLIGMSYGIEAVALSECDLIKHTMAENEIATAFELFSKNHQLMDCRGRFFAKFNFDLEMLNAPWVIFWTSCISVSRSDVARVGGFDERFCAWGGEDVDLGYRLFHAGCKFVLHQSLLTVHYPHEKDIENKEEQAKGNVAYLMRKYSDQWINMLVNKSWSEICEQSLKPVHAQPQASLFEEANE